MNPPFLSFAKANRRMTEKKLEEAGRMLNNLSLMACSQGDGIIPDPPLTSTQSEEGDIKYMFHKDDTVKELLKQNMNPANFPRNRMSLKGS